MNVINDINGHLPEKFDPRVLGFKVTQGHWNQDGWVWLPMTFC